jgi:hypothetical protein
MEDIIKTDLRDMLANGRNRVGYGHCVSFIVMNLLVS